MFAALRVDASVSKTIERSSATATPTTALSGAPTAFTLATVHIRAVRRKPANRGAVASASVRGGAPTSSTRTSASGPTTVVHFWTFHASTSPFATYGSFAANASAAAGESPRKSSAVPTAGSNAPPSTSSPRRTAARAKRRCSARKLARRSR